MHIAAIAQFDRAMNLRDRAGFGEHTAWPKLKAGDSAHARTRLAGVVLAAVVATVAVA